MNAWEQYHIQRLTKNNLQLNDTLTPLPHTTPAFLLHHHPYPPPLPTSAHPSTFPHCAENFQTIHTTENRTPGKVTTNTILRFYIFLPISIR
jgi:hypothetical protein